MLRAKSPIHSHWEHTAPGGRTWMAAASLARGLKFALRLVDRSCSLAAPFVIHYMPHRVSLATEQGGRDVRDAGALRPMTCVYGDRPEASP